MDTGIKEQQSIRHSVRELLVSKAIDFEMFNKVKACQVRVITVHDFPPLFNLQRHLFPLCVDSYCANQTQLQYKLYIPQIQL